MQIYISTKHKELFEMACRFNDVDYEFIRDMCLDGYPSSQYKLTAKLPISLFYLGIKFDQLRQDNKYYES